MAAKKSFLLRIDAELWKALEKWSQDELRSVNGQIEYILRAATIKRGLLKTPAPTQDERGGD